MVIFSISMKHIGKTLGNIGNILGHGIKLDEVGTMTQHSAEVVWLQGLQPTVGDKNSTE